jgi:hypothetical protein
MCLRLSLLALSFAIGAASAAPPPPHPKLLCSDAGIAQIRAEARSDSLMAALLTRLEQRADACLTAPAIRHRLIGPRLLDQSRAAIRQILSCAFEYRLTGEQRYLERARRDLRTVCAFSDWNPSHFLDVAEMTFAVSIGYDWLYGQLSPEDRQSIEAALLTKSLVFANAAYAPGGPTDRRVHFPLFEHNWNQVCNGGMLAGALALADLRPVIARKVVDGAERSLPRAMARYEPDGAYPEGPGYWAYGTTYNCLAIDMLESAWGEDAGLDRQPAFAKTDLYLVQMRGPTGLFFNYADGGSKMSETSALGWLGRRYGHPATLALAREMLRQSLAHPPRQPLDGDRFLALYAIWFPAAPAEAAPGLPMDQRFRGPAEIAVFRSRWDDPNAIYAGLKAGSNTVNHAHLDLGSFILEADGVRWAEDLGPDNYNLPGYFGKQRWGYFRLNNLSHNTLTVGGRLQDPKAAAPIVAFTSNPALASATADLTAAYPGAARRLLRTVSLIDRRRFRVEDDYDGLRASTPLRWTMATRAEITLSTDAQGGTLSTHGKSLHFELRSKGFRFKVEPARPPTAAEDQNRGVSLLIAEGIPADPKGTIVVDFNPRP